MDLRLPRGHKGRRGRRWKNGRLRRRDQATRVPSPRGADLGGGWGRPAGGARGFGKPATPGGEGALGRRTSSRCAAHVPCGLRFPRDAVRWAGPLEIELEIYRGVALGLCGPQRTKPYAADGRRHVQLDENGRKSESVSQYSMENGDGRYMIFLYLYN
ncbi:hypothetical protein PVAP13_9NG014651 [Panicum virgatum]|uniref:Uncharacterized protein n=1 Tax=Panicum virgatum TaxID=38727 RepID=A0A8T0MBJ8_PANVG|nr:hypothetical protein PVAP13_9NG014651 [Panicum virgatum]